MRQRITEVDYIKANRKAAREDEIRLYGKQISNRTTIQRSKKAYNRQRDKKVPLFLYFDIAFVKKINLLQNVCTLQTFLLYNIIRLLI